MRSFFVSNHTAFGRPKATDKKAVSQSLKLLISFAFFVATSSAYAAIVTQEYDTFFLQYDDTAVADYGTPIVGGSTVFFLPTDMSIEAPVNFHDAVSEGPWTTSFGIIAKEGYSVNGLTFAEQGDYSYTQPDTVTGVEDDYSVEARLFVRDAFNPLNNSFLTFDHSFGESENTQLAFWGHEENYDVSNFSAGMWVTVQNTLLLTNNQPTDPNNFFGNMPGMFLQKKFVGFEFDIVPDTPQVPVPAAAWLFGSALLGLTSLRRRK